MFSYIRGRLTESNGNSVTVEAGGIGYAITVSNNSAYKLPLPGNETLIYLYLHVREDEVGLYGFTTREEKEMFIKLIAISGIGPKAAIGILSGMTPDALAIAIVTSDIKSIAKIKGVGKKTAERIILELKEKLAAEDVEMFGAKAVAENSVGGVAHDAINALRTLGLTQSEAVKAVEAAMKEADTLEEVLRCTLRRIEK